MLHPKRKTKIPSQKKTGLDAKSPHSGLAERSTGVFFLDILSPKTPLTGESPQAEVRVWPPVSGAIGFVVGGIVLRSTASPCRRKLDRT